MAKKIRKMLGDVNAPEIVALMRLIDTQSKSTICKWCMDYAEAHILPIFENLGGALCRIHLKQTAFI